MKTGWKTITVAAVVLALVGGLVLAGPGGGAGWGRGPAHRGGPGMGMGMGMGPGMGMGRGMGPGMGWGMGMGPGMGPCWQGPGPMGPGARGLGPLGPARGNALGPIGAWLDLTDDQKDKIREIHEQAKADAEAVRDAVAEAREALHEAVTGGAAEADVRAAAATLGTAIANQAALHAKTLAAVKAVLTDEQRKKFDEMRAERPGLRRGMPEGQAPDGGVTPLEQMFKQADANKDGKLTMEELQAFKTARGGGPMRPRR